jgi:hypothetical protein
MVLESQSSMKVLVALLLALAGVWNVAAEEARIPLIQPTLSPLTLATLSTMNEHHAEFNGQLWIAGTLYVEWLGDDRKVAEYRLVPDRESQAKLPHFAGYGVTWIEPRDGAAALRMAVRPNIYQRVMEHRTKLFEVTGVWKLKDFAVGIECDAPYAHATIVAVDVPDQRLVASVARPETC